MSTCPICNTYIPAECLDSESGGICYSCIVTSLLEEEEKSSFQLPKKVQAVPEKKKCVYCENHVDVCDYKKKTDTVCRFCKEAAIKTATECFKMGNLKDMEESIFQLVRAGEIDEANKLLKSQRT